MKKVLIISYAFPPMGVVGIYRPVKFCKFLPEFGWEPVILTVRKKYYDTSEESLANELEQFIKVYRCRHISPLSYLNGVWKRSARDGGVEHSREFSRATDFVERFWNTSIKNGIRLLDMLSIPDAYNSWIPSAVYTGLRVIREEQIDAVVSTIPPESAHLVGYFLSVFTGVPLVIDYRDPWAIRERYEARRFAGIYHFINRFLERRAIRRTKAVINVHASFSRMMQVENIFKRRDRFYTITNGLDPDDFKSLELPVRKNIRFTMLHLGTLYDNRDPGFFLKALSLWVERRPEVSENVVIHFIGFHHSEHEKLVIDSGLGKVVRFSERLPQIQALAKMWEADVLLLFLGFQRRFGGVLQAKFFEYIATGRPILAFVPPGEAERIIEKYQRGIAVTSPDIEKTCAFLDMEYDKWRGSGPIRRSEVFIPPEFNRRNQVKHLAEILDVVSRPRNN